MEETADLAALSQKLDVLSVQVGFLIEQAQETARRQRERSELLHDALPIANDALGLATEQLAEIQEYIDLSDILRFLKRLLRNSRNLDKTLDQLESLMDLASTAGPLANDVLEKVTGLLETAEQRGYFALAKGGARAVDQAVLGLSQPAKSASVRSLLRQLRDEDTRRGLAIVLQMLQALGAQAGGANPTVGPGR